jgi:DNA-binding XRE family transcriptional regulator
MDRYSPEIAIIEKMNNSNIPGNFSELKDSKYGPEGSLQRADFQSLADAYRVGQKIRAIRLRKGMTQQQLAERIGTQKSYISKIEKGADMQLSTLFKIFDHGLESPITLITGEIL